ncbi:hypothetical protein F4802DRAFT_334357 [Xylaria palmicola]|nr:hypothetical protein F4802DRAFT_334357 [Xylaria palmicola]
MCNRFGRTEIHSSGGQYGPGVITETPFSPTLAQLPAAICEVQRFANPLCPVVESPMLPLTSSMLGRTPELVKLRSARNLFQQYNISRPSGWLSDMEGLSLSGDGNASPRRYCRYCHMCSTPTWAPTHCSSCGHRLCSRCMCEVSGGTPQPHANSSHHPNPIIPGDSPKYVSASRPSLDPIHHPEVSTTCSSFKGQDQGNIEIKHHRLPILRADSSWWKPTGERRGNTAFSEASVPPRRDHSYMDKEQSKQMHSRSMRPIEQNPFLLRDKNIQEQGTGELHLHLVNPVECTDPMRKATHAEDMSSKHEKGKNGQGPGNPSNGSFGAQVVERPNSTEVQHSGAANIIHRHHSAGFHSQHHIAEHLSSAVGYDAYDLLKGRSGRNIQPTLRTRAKLTSHIEPFTVSKPVTQINPFKWTQDVVRPGHPSRSGEERHQNPEASKVTTNASNHQPPKIMDTMSEEVTNHSDLTPARRDNEPPKVRLVSTPSWLRTPTKEAADATAPLLHVNTTRHTTHGHNYSGLRAVTDDGWKTHAVTPSRSPALIKRQNPYSVVPKVPEPPDITPKEQVGHNPNERKQRCTPVSVSKLREAFEPTPHPRDIASSASHVRETRSQQAQHQGANSTAQSGMPQSPVER